MDKIEEYQMVRCIVDTGSLTNAAHKLKLSRSAVSKRLSALEDRLGIKLIDRSTKSLAVTERGLLFYEKAREILESVSELEDLLSADNEQAGGRIHVSMPKALVQSQYMKKVSSFFRQYPQFKLDLTISDKLDNLIDQRIDFAVRIGTLEDSRLHAKKIGRANSIICASQLYIESAPTINSLGDVVNHTLLLPSYINLAKNPLWQYFKQLAHLEKSHMIDDASAIIALAKNGMGIAITLDVAAEEAINKGELVQLFPSLVMNTTDISLVYLSQRYLSKRSLLFKEFMTNDIL